MSFSDPNWWPTPPPQKATPTAKLVTTGIVSVVVVAGVVALLVGMHGHKGNAAKEGVKMAAYASCVRSHGGPSQDCAQAEGDAFRECLHNAGYGGRSGFGRFGGVSGPSSGYRQAVQDCQSELELASRVGPSPPAPTTTGSAPIA